VIDGDGLDDAVASLVDVVVAVVEPPVDVIAVGLGDTDVDAVRGGSVPELGAGLLQPTSVSVRRAAAPQRRTIIRAD
jgi:hypothetical protein